MKIVYNASHSQHHTSIIFIAFTTYTRVRRVLIFDFPPFLTERISQALSLADQNEFFQTLLGADRPHRRSTYEILRIARYAILCILCTYYYF